MKHFPKPVKQCITTAVMTSAMLEAYALPPVMALSADASSQPPRADAVTVQTEPVAIRSPQPIAPPEAIPSPQPSPAADPAPAPSLQSGAASLMPSPSPSPAPEVSPAPSPAASLAPTAEASPAPNPAPAAEASPAPAPTSPAEAAVDRPNASATGNNATGSQGNAAAPAAGTANQSNPTDRMDAARRNVADKLAAIVSRDKAAKDARLRESLMTLALQSALRGQFDLALQIAHHPALPADIQADLLAKISVIALQQGHPLPTALQQPGAPGQPSEQPTQTTTAAAPGETSPAISTIPYSPVPPSTYSFNNYPDSNRCLLPSLAAATPAQPAASKPTAKPAQKSKQQSLAALLNNSSSLNSSASLQVDSLLAGDRSHSVPAPASSSPAANQSAELPADLKLDSMVGATLHKSLNKVGVSLPAPIHSALESALSWWSYLTGIDRSVTNTSFSPFSGSSLGATGLAAGPASNASMLDISQQLLSSLDHISPLPDKALPAPTPAKAVEVSNKPAADPIALAGGCGGSADTGSLQLAYNPNSNAFGRLSWGNYTFPLSIPAVVTSTFGWRIHPIFGDRRFHPGVDLGAPYGTPVVAAQPGRVVMADYMGGYGLAIVVENPATAQRNLYGHLSSVAVQPGMEVQKGSVIGFVGSTGNSTGPHLHFETQVMAGGDWTVIDPMAAAVAASTIAAAP